jgi:hypothetical protein
MCCPQGWAPGLTHNYLTWLEMPARDEHCRLFGPFVNYDEKSYSYMTFMPGLVFTKHPTLYPVGYLLIWNPSNFLGALSPNLPTPLSHFDHLVVKLKTTVLASTLSLF